MSPGLSEFDYDLPPELIAQSPLGRRDESRLLVLRRADGRMSHRVFRELPALLREGDLLVVNDTGVIPAKFACRRPSGGRIEGLFLREISPGLWEVMLRNAGRVKVAEPLSLVGAEETRLELRENLGQGLWRVGVVPRAGAVEILRSAGRTPLPPYIRRTGRSADSADRARYQTVYAAKPGAVAAPTAGLHFTEELLEKLQGRGVRVARVTLHVGLGTFAPVKAERAEDHRMHAEWYELPAAAADQLNAARREGRRIVAVGTTSVRVLETACRPEERARSGADGRPADGLGDSVCGSDDDPVCRSNDDLHTLRSPQVCGSDDGSVCRSNDDLHTLRSVRSLRFRPVSGWTDIFIYPPYRFRAVDAMITNFHLPRSTLLMLVAAFCSPGETSGLRMVLDAYREAVRLRYRFYSYGDAMLIE